tara:strand:- start:3033 stop:3611 length:579 start_codon:yes stop_codon:yes gene_type:complete
MDKTMKLREQSNLNKENKYDYPLTPGIVKDDEGKDRLKLILTEQVKSLDVIIKLWTEVFPTIVIWSDEEIKEQLTEVYDFNEKETNILLDKYKTQIKRKVSPFKEMTSLPDLEKIDPILHPVINSSWQSYLSFKKSRQQLNHSEIQRYLDSKSKMDFEKSKDEKDLIEKKMLEIDKLMVKRIRSFLVEEEAA